jgi:23S rRNA pseudouridine2605 synthase
MSFNSNRNSRDGKPNRMNKSNNENRFGKDRGSRPARPSSDSRENSNRSFEKDRKPGRDSSSPRDRFSKNDDRRSSDRKSFGSERKSFDTDKDRRPKPEGRFSDRQERGERRRSSERSEHTEGRSFDKNKTRPSFADKKSDFRPKRSDKPFEKREVGRPAPRKRSEEKTSNSSPSHSKRRESEEIRLNRYIANAGVCSRRKADELIAAGVVTVNGEVVTALGTKVNPAVDDVRYNGERLKREKMVYVLLNKPKDYITTTDDPQERRTVMHLVEKATKERIYPVGRLDRNTTGLLLMTNDGALAEKLSHPRNSVTKIYHVELDKNLLQGDLNKIQFGLELEDGLIKPDEVSYVQGASKREIGIQIHSGKNRIVRRIFESLGYNVIKLDRVIYANLTKKDLPRGRWRYLEEREVIQLKHFMK